MNPDILALLTTEVGLTDQEIADLSEIALGTVQSELAAGVISGEASLDSGNYYLGVASAPEGPAGDLVENITVDTGELDFNSNKITNVTDPTSPQDAATKAYVDANESDELAKVSANDTTASYLGTKLTAGSNVTLTEQNDGGNETLEISAATGGSDELAKVSANDTTAGFLNGKLVAGANVTLSEQNDGGNESLQVGTTGLQLTSEKDANGGYVGLDGSGNAVVPERLTVKDLDVEDAGLAISQVISSDGNDAMIIFRSTGASTPLAAVGLHQTSGEFRVSKTNGLDGSLILRVTNSEFMVEGKRVSDVVDPVGAQDAATKNYVDSNDTDETAKVSANDTTAGFLGAKLAAGTNITLTEQNDGGNETLQISASGGGVTVDPVAVSCELTASTTLTTTLTAIPHTSSVNTGEFTVNSNSITVNQDGTYVISATAYIDQFAGNSRSSGEFDIRINSVRTAASGYYSRNQADGEGTASMTWVADLTSGDVVELRGQCENNTWCQVQAGSWFSIFALNGAQGAAGATGPQGPAGNDGADGVDGQNGDARISVSANDTTTDYAINKIVAGSNVTITELNNGGSETLEISASGGGGTDELAKVSANDTTAGFLNGKLVAGTNVTLTENNNGGNETLTIAASGGGGADEQAKVSANDTTSGFLGAKIVAGSNVTITELNDGSNETLQIAASGGGGGGGVFTWHGDARWDFDNANQWYGPGYLTAGVNDILWNASYGTGATPSVNALTQGIVFPRASRILKWTMWFHPVFAATVTYDLYLTKMTKTDNSSSVSTSQIGTTGSFSSGSIFGRTYLFEQTFSSNNTLAANDILALSARSPTAGRDIRVNIAMEWEHQ